MTADFTCDVFGSIALLRPNTPEATKWLDFNCVPEPWQWFMGAMAVEPRALDDVIDGLEAEGFTVD
jgi:hypothetical protein